MIWKDGKGEWRVLRDSCPHRLVPLSEGRVTPEGRLECGYHGWQFEGNGKCTAMPEGGNPASLRACASSYPCTIKQGTLFHCKVLLPAKLLVCRAFKSLQLHESLIARECVGSH